MESIKNEEVSNGVLTNVKLNLIIVKNNNRNRYLKTNMIAMQECLKYLVLTQEKESD